MSEKRGCRPLGFAALGLALAVSGCAKKEQTPGMAEVGKAESPASFWSATPFGGGEIIRATVTLDGQPVKIGHSKLDMGRPEDLFDNDLQTVARTVKANPAVITLDFSSPRAMKGISVTTGSMDIGLMARVTGAGGSDPKVYSKEFRELPPDPTVELDFDALTEPVKTLHIEVTSLRGSDGHLHLREIRFN